MFSIIRYKLLVLFLILAVLLPTTPLATAQDSGGGPLVGFNVSYGGKTYDSSTNQTTFTYVVSGTGQAPDLLNFDVGIPVCGPPLIVVGTSPEDALRFGIDPATGVDGVKWGLPLQTTETRTYTLTFLGNVGEGTVTVAVNGETFQVGSLPGPSCTVASIDIDKFVSTDGSTWQTADEFPGPEVEPGTPVSFRFIVTNIGSTELGNLALSDSLYDTSSCAVPDTLAPSASFECIIGSFPAVDGQHTNTATVSGSTTDGLATTASDIAYYFSGGLPLVEVDKLISIDGGITWADSVEVVVGADVSFKFVVTNSGNVPLSGFTLSDSAFDTSACALPATLDPDASFDCVIGPFPAGETEHTNTVTVGAAYQGQAVTATDTASYGPVSEGSTGDVIIVVEGPVENINVNIITIFGIDIEVSPDDPSLTRLALGDTVRVEGDIRGKGNTIVIVAVTVIVININIIVFQVGAPPSIPLVVPANCKITGIGSRNPHLKCTKKHSKKS